MFFYGTWQDLKDVTICSRERYGVLRLPGCFLKVTYYLCRIVALPRIRKLRDNANIK